MILQALSALGGGIIDRAIGGGSGGGSAPAGPVTTGDFKFGDVNVTGKTGGVNPWGIVAGLGVVSLVGLVAINLFRGKK